MDLAGPPAEAPSKSLPPPTQGQGGAGGSGSDDSDDEEPVADFDGRWGGVGCCLLHVTGPLDTADFLKATVVQDDPVSPTLTPPTSGRSHTSPCPTGHTPTRAIG